MSKLSSIVFVADYTEAGRDLKASKRWKAADEGLENAIVAGIDSTIRHVLRKDSRCTRSQ